LKFEEVNYVAAFEEYELTIQVTPELCAFLDSQLPSTRSSNYVSAELER
jgi:hypothetical protein